MNSSDINFQQFAQEFSVQLSDYISAIAWSPQGKNLLAATSLPLEK
jgi:hypothetical protein